MTNVVGIAWYQREDYPELLALFIDRVKLPSTWEGWRVSFYESWRLAVQLKTTPVLVTLRPVEFATWCQAKRLAPDGRTRIAHKHERQHEHGDAIRP